MEIWRDVKRYEGLYQVSNLGRVKSLDTKDWVQPSIRNGAVLNGFWRLRKGRILLPLVRNKSLASPYLCVKLCKDKKAKTISIHTLVASAFPEICGEWFPGAEINHLDENPSNNNAENLRWVDKKTNINWGTRNQRVAGHFNKPVYQYTLSGEFVREWESVASAGRNGYNRTGIIFCCSGYHKTSKGYRWSYTKTEAIN